MNGNSSKQVLLSVLGIAVLVVAVVGVSFAFFSYSKTGTTNNVIQTGRIYTYLKTGSDVTLTNAFPKLTDLETASASAQTDVAVIEFDVYGMNESTTPIKYNVYLVPGDTPDGYTGTGKGRLKDSEVSVIMTATGAGATSNITSPAPISTLLETTGTDATLSDTNGALIASSQFNANPNANTAITGQDIQHHYVLNMYVNNTVKISDTDDPVNGTKTKYCAHARVGTGTGPVGNTSTDYGCELDLPVYTDQYYSVKVRVVANTTPGTNNANLASTNGGVVTQP